MNPADRKYTAEHEWAKISGDVVRVGITDFAQSALGDIVFVTLPSAGTDVQAGQAFGEVESTKSVSDLCAPVSGTVVAANTALESAPELLNSDPYGEGWIVEIRPSDPAEIDKLMDAAAYEQHASSS